MDFTESTIAALFGQEAAEDESASRLSAYYLKNATFDRVKTDLPLRVLVGHKGIGKSALFQIAMQEETRDGHLALLIKPDDIAGIAEDETDFLKMIREWKAGISEIIARRTRAAFGIPADAMDWAAHAQNGPLVDYLKHTIRSAKFIDPRIVRKTPAAHFLEAGRVYVYLDDLDRGWKGRPQDIKKIAALLNAVRDMAAESADLSFRVGLRSDMYYLIRTSDESTDKLEGSVIWHTWGEHDMLALFVKRVEHFAGRTHSDAALLAQSDPSLVSALALVLEPVFQGKGNWSSIPMHQMMMSLFRKRPRDLVKLCTLAARRAKARQATRLGTQDFNAVFEEYSQGRMQDTINEYKSELPEIERLMLGMKPSKQGKYAKEGYVYGTEALLKKITNIEHGGSFTFSSGKKADKRELAAFLYKINFLTARRDEGASIERRYCDESRYLSLKFVDFGYDWEVHPAYRWALQPDI